jgi:hypothetical protein
MGCGSSKFEKLEIAEKDEKLKENVNEQVEAPPNKSLELSRKEIQTLSIVPKPITRRWPCKFDVDELMKDINDYNLICSVYYGLLDKDTDFTDCIIRSELDLVINLKYKVAHEIGFDEIFMNEEIIEWDTYFLIAIRGAYIEHVKLENRVYMVLPAENEKVDMDEYCAAVINKKVETHDEQADERTKTYQWKFIKEPIRIFETLKPIPAKKRFSFDLTNINRIRIQSIQTDIN